MSETLERFFATHGQAVAAGANRPVRVDEEAGAWLVVAGTVDLFGVDTEPGPGQGRREHLCSFGAGSVILGGALAADAARPWGLLAVGGLETRLYRMERLALLQEAPAEMLGPALNHFFGVLSHMSRRYPRPQATHLLESGQQVEVGPGAVVGSKDEVIWVRLEAGKAAFAGDEALVLGPEDGFVPLGEGLWLQCPEGARLTAQAAPPAEDSAARAADKLDRFLHFFLVWIGHKMVELRWADRSRLRGRGEFDARFRQQALHNLAASLKLDEEEAADPGQADGVFAVFKAIGRAAGIDFRQPPRWQTPWLWDRQRGGPQAVRHKEHVDPVKVICQFSKVRYRKIVFAGEWWRKDSGPLLGFFKSEEEEDDASMIDRAVAILPLGPDRYEVFDPRDGSRRPLDEDLVARLESFGYMFYRPFLAEALRVPAVARYVAPEVLGDIRLVLLTSLAGMLLGLITPLVTAHLFNTVIPSSDEGQLGQIFVLMLVASFAGILFSVTQGWSMMRIESKANASLQAAMFDRLLRLPLPFFREYSTGDLAIRSTGVNRVRQAISGAALTILMTVFAGLSNLGVMFYYSTKMVSGPQGAQGGVGGTYILILAGLAILALNMTLTIAFAYYTLQYQRRMTEVAGRLSSLVLQLLSAIAKLRVSGMEARAFSVWSMRFREQNVLSFKATHLGNYVGIYNVIIPTFSSVLFYWLISYLLEQSGGLSVSTGYFLAFFTAFTTFMGSVTSLASTLVGLVNIVPAIERSRPLIETPSEVDPDMPSPGQLEGNITASHLMFRYKEDGPLILNDVSFEIAPGEFVAFVGPSGSGKSTTLRMLLGFEQPESGSVFFDGQALQTVDVTAVRQQIGVVSQQSGVLAGSILQNILGASNRTLDDAWEAARMAGMEEDIKQMPMGMHTVVSEGGSTLSGGQRQRLLIARALVSKPRIIFFDEATSALDNRTQQIVTDSLEQMHATRLVIAHRLSTIQHADRIYCMDAGRIVQVGSPAELLEQPGLFADLAARQLA